jgi:hypothetical protein
MTVLGATKVLVLIMSTIPVEGNEKGYEEAPKHIIKFLEETKIKCKLK